MRERFMTGLDELSRVPMSAGLLERAEGGSRLPDPPRPGAPRRVAIVILALGVFVAGSLGAWERLRPRGHETKRPAATPRPTDVESAKTSQFVFGQTVCSFHTPADAKSGGSAGSAPPPSDPIQACRELWLQSYDEAPPELIACVLPNWFSWYIVVVEASTSPDGTCAGLHGSPPPDGWQETLARWRAAEAAVKPSFPEGGTMNCERNLRTAVDVWRNALDANGFTAWKVVVDNKFPGRPCFNYDEDYGAMQVRIVHDTVS